MESSISDILIIGDSFCVDRNEIYDWPGVLNKKFSTSTLRGRGFPGCSFWPVRQLFYQEIAKKTPDLLILCHTTAGRYPCQFGEPGGYTSNSGDKTFSTWFRKYFNFDFHIWAVHKWYDELDSCLGNLQIPYIIHLFCFTENRYLFKNGITGTESLIEVHQLCEKFHKTSGHKNNHFCKQDNIQIANILHKKIIQLPKGLNNTMVDFEFRKIYEK